MTTPTPAAGEASPGPAIEPAEPLRDAFEDDETVDVADREELPVASEEAASAVLETAAQRRGLQVQRHGSDLLVCTDGERRMAFRGLCGSLSGKVAYTLCGNDAWLRRHLQGRGLPTLGTQLVGITDPERAEQAAHRLGFPVALRLVPERGSDTVDGKAPDVAALHKLWQQLQDAAADQRAQVIVESQPDDAAAIEVAVVGGQVVALRPTPDAAGLEEPDPYGEAPMATAPTLAVAAVAALPGAAYASVRLLADRSVADGQPSVVVDAVDPAFAAWVDPADGSVAAIADAVLELEIPSIENASPAGARTG